MSNTRKLSSREIQKVLDLLIGETEAVADSAIDARIEERDKKIKAMNVDELIENLHDENGYGKFIVLEMKERYDSLDMDDKMKIIDTLSATTKANQNWAEGKRKKLNKEEQ